jgi:hypothetical protein
VGGDPNVDLLKAIFPDLFQILKESEGGGIVGIDADANELVPVPRATLFPGAGDANGILGDAAEALAQFLGGLIKSLCFNFRTVIIGQR